MLLSLSVVTVWMTLLTIVIPTETEKSAHQQSQANAPFHLEKSKLEWEAKGTTGENERETRIQMF